MTAANLTRYALSNMDKSMQTKVVATPPIEGEGPRRFSQALAQAQAAQSTTMPVAGSAAVADVDAKLRARRTLELDRHAPTHKREGDSILEGLTRLRGVFDAQEARLGDAMAAPMETADDMFKVQVEMVQYSMLIEISSKLTGKATQAFETLLKGQ